MFYDFYFSLTWPLPLFQNQFPANHTNVAIAGGDVSFLPAKVVNYAESHDVLHQPPTWPKSKQNPQKLIFFHQIKKWDSVQKKNPFSFQRKRKWKSVLKLLLRFLQLDASWEGAFIWRGHEHDGLKQSQGKRSFTSVAASHTGKPLFKTILCHRLQWLAYNYDIITVDCVFLVWHFLQQNFRTNEMFLCCAMLIMAWGASLVGEGRSLVGGTASCEKNCRGESPNLVRKGGCVAHWSFVLKPPANQQNHTEICN